MVTVNHQRVVVARTTGSMRRVVPEPIVVVYTRANLGHLLRLDVKYPGLSGGNLHVSVCNIIDLRVVATAVVTRASYIVGGQKRLMF